MAPGDPSPGAIGISRELDFPAVFANDLVE
jgi:hypothetical protein